MKLINDLNGKILFKMLQNISKVINMKKNKFYSEYILHKLTEKNLKKLFDLKFVASEIQLNNLRIDTPSFDEKTKAFVIIE